MYRIFRIPNQQNDVMKLVNSVILSKVATSRAKPVERLNSPSDVWLN
jgi:hypothetical protein